MCFDTHFLRDWSLHDVGKIHISRSRSHGHITPRNLSQLELVPLVEWCVEELLNETNESQGYQGSRFSRNSGSIERVQRAHADPVKERTETALDLDLIVVPFQFLESGHEAMKRSYDNRL